MMLWQLPRRSFPLTRWQGDKVVSLRTELIFKGQAYLPGACTITMSPSLTWSQSNSQSHCAKQRSWCTNTDTSSKISLCKLAEVSRQLSQPLAHSLSSRACSTILAWSRSNSQSHCTKQRRALMRHKALAAPVVCDNAKWSKHLVRQTSASGGGYCCKNATRSATISSDSIRQCSTWRLERDHLRPISVAAAEDASTSNRSAQKITPSKVRPHRKWHIFLANQIWMITYAHKKVNYLL